MENKVTLLELVERWKRSGGAQSLEELCTDVPQLLPEFQQCIGRLRDLVANPQASEQNTSAAAEAADVASRNMPIIPRYRLLRLIGSGGMGTVYEAEQSEPRRIVALKVVRPGLASPELLRRFRLEAEVLGRLQHAGIGQIYESGSAETGEGPQPFLAMELVQGSAANRPPTITEYALAQQLSTSQRLELLAKVADAVHYAHQRGVIHRDLKPSNILIDQTGQPKVVDFGVARLMDAEQNLTLYTTPGQLVGTLQYMAPEQASGHPVDVDTRADVYSLGVILYELLTESPPYRISGRSLTEALRVLRDEEPTSLSAINRRFRGDLDCIVRRAMEKDKERRYTSASELAADIRRHLAGETIIAHPPSAWYQIRKLARRHKAAVMGMVAVAAALLIGIAGTTWQAIRASHATGEVIEQRNAALIQKGIAQSNERKARRNYAFGLINQGAASVSSGNLREAKQRFEEAAGEYIAIGDSPRLADLPLLEAYQAAPPAFSILDSGSGSTAAQRVLPDGRHVLVARKDGVAIFDLATSCQVALLKSPEPLVAALAITRDGQFAVAGTDGGSVVMWDVPARRQLAKIPGLTKAAQAVAISDDGATIASGRDGRLLIIDTKSSAVLHDLEAHTQAFRTCGLAFSPDGRLLLSGSADLKVKVWDVQHGSALHTFTQIPDVVMAVDFSPDGGTAIACAAEQVLLWDVMTGRYLRGYPAPYKTSGVGFTPAGIVVTDRSGTQLWDGHTGRVRVSFSEGAMLASTSQKQIVLTSVAGTLLHWGLEPSQESLPLRGHNGTVVAADLAPDGRMVATGGCDQTLRLWDCATGLELLCAPTPPTVMKALRFSPDGRMIASIHGDGRIRIWDAHTCTILKTLPGHTGDGKCLDFSHDGKMLASGGYDLMARTWDVESGRQLASFSRRQKEPYALFNTIFAVRFSADDSRVWTAGVRGGLLAFDPRTGSQVQAVHCHNDTIFGMALLPGEQEVMIGCVENAYLVNIAADSKIRTFHGTKGTIRGVSVSPDGLTAASTGNDGQLRFWDVASGALLSQNPLGTNYVGGVHSYDGAWLIAVGNGERPMLRDLTRGTRYRQFASSVPAARERLRINPADGASLRTLAQWYAFRGASKWSADLYQNARAAGADVSPLELARSSWLAGDRKTALREFENARARKEAPVQYLNQCIAAVEKSDRADLSWVEGTWQMTRGTFAVTRVAGGFECVDVRTKQRSLASASLEEGLMLHWTAQEVLMIRPQPGNPDVAWISLYPFAAEFGFFNQAAPADAFAWRAKAVRVSPAGGSEKAITRFAVPVGTQIGGFEAPYHSDDRPLAANNSPLVGFNVGLANPGGIVMVSSLQPAFRTAGGVVMGSEHGMTFIPGKMLIAKEGYAVGGIVARMGDLITGLKVVFMRLEQGRLNLKDSYESEWIGGTIGDLEVSCISSDGRPIAGIMSYAGAHLDGLMLLPAEPLAEIVAVTSTRPASRPATNPSRPEARDLVALKREADQLAQRYRFAEAASLFSELGAARPGDSLFFLLQAVAVLESGDVPAYQALCHGGLVRFQGSRETVVARRVSKTCLLGPLAPDDLKKACELADKALAQQQEAKFLVHARMGKGLAELRREHFREAIGPLRQVIATSGDGGPQAARQIEAAAYAAMAMANHGCGEDVEARAALDKASRIIKDNWPHGESADLGPSWQEAVIAHILLTEAAKILGQ